MIRTAQELMQANMIVKHYAGSLAYGTNLPTSDVDFRGVFVADPINIRTPFYTVKEVDDTSEEDTKLYELSQFMKLSLDCNPNVIETLWVDPASIVVTTPAYDMLRQAAPSLLSSKIAYTTVGYATSQLKRIKGHNKWINNPQSTERPQQVDFVSLVHTFAPDKLLNLNLRTLAQGYRLVPYSGNTYGVYHTGAHSPFNPVTGSLNTDYQGDSHLLGTPEYIVKFNAEAYNAARDTWENYWEWKKNRNVKRSELEEAHGFDTKHAMHLVRLLRMGAEALETGVIQVHRPDAAELLDIRHGKWTYNQIVEYAEHMSDLVLNKLIHTTQLPKRPDIKLAAKVMMEVQDLVWAT